MNNEDTITLDAGILKEITKTQFGKLKKVHKKEDYQKFSEDQFLENAEDLTSSFYKALLLQMQTNPNPKFIELAGQLLGLIKSPAGISINTTTISNSGNTQTNVRNVVGGSFEQIAERYHSRESKGLNDEYQRKFLGKPADEVIAAEIVDEDKKDS